MPACKHSELVFVGEQKTEGGVNGYFRCKACDEVIVVTPGRKTVGIKGRQ